MIPGRLQHVERRLRRIALGDPADVELHARLQRAGRSARPGRAPSCRSRRASGPRRSAGGSGSFRSRRARRQSRPTGAIVTSNAPPDRSYIRLRSLEHVEQVGADAHRRPRRPTARAARARSRGRNRSDMALSAAIRSKAAREARLAVASSVEYKTMLKWAGHVRLFELETHQPPARLRDPSPGPAGQHRRRPAATRRMSHP